MSAVPPFGMAACKVISASSILPRLASVTSVTLKPIVRSAAAMKPSVPHAVVQRGDELAIAGISVVADEQVYFVCPIDVAE